MSPAHNDGAEPRIFHPGIWISPVDFSGLKCFILSDTRKMNHNSELQQSHDGHLNECKLTALCFLIKCIINIIPVLSPLIRSERPGSHDAAVQTEAAAGLPNVQASVVQELQLEQHFSKDSLTRAALGTFRGFVFFNLEYKSVHSRVVIWWHYKKLQGGAQRRSGGKQAGYFQVAVEGVEERSLGQHRSINI